MAEADGSIIINTEIEADGMKAGSKEVEDHLRKMATAVDGLGKKLKAALNEQINTFEEMNREYAAQEKKVEELKQKAQEYANQKVPTQEYKSIQDTIDKTSQRMDNLIRAQQQFMDLGGSVNDDWYKNQQQDIDKLSNEIREAKKELRKLESAEKAFTLGDKAEEAAENMEKLAVEEKKLSNMKKPLGKAYSGVKRQVEDYKRTLLKTDSAQKKASASGRKFSKTLKDTGKSAKSAQFGIGKMLGTSLLFSFVFRAISAATSAIKDGFTNLAQYSGSTNKSISMLWSSLERLKNSLATAFAPILDVIAPILTKFIDMLSTAASYVSMFFAFLSGKSTYTKAVAVQKDYASSLQDTATGAKDAAEETEKAAEAAEDYLSPLDDINRYTEQSSSSSGNNGGGNNGGVGGTIPEGPFFEEVEITDIPILQKVKDTLASLFKPFKEAWQAEGKNTIDAAKYALSSLGDLAKSVGRSLLEVWTNGTGTQMLSTMLRIAQQVLILIGNIATKLKEAWETNNVGTRIIQAIADIIQTVLDFVERIAKATADWAANLDFYPLLESIARLLESIKPIVQAIGDFLYKIYTTIILPVAKFLIETALPAIINALAGLFEFLGKHQWIIEAVGAALIGAFAASKLVPVIMTVVKTIGKVFGIIRPLISILMNGGGLGAAISYIVGLLGGPLTLAIIAIIAIGILLITHWDDIKAAAAELAEQIKLRWEAIKTTTELIWNSVKQSISNTWAAIKVTIELVLNGIKQFISNTWAAIKVTIELVWNGIKQFLSDTWDAIKQKTSDIWNGIKQFLSDTWDSIKQKASDIWNGITGILQGFDDFLSGIFTQDFQEQFGVMGDILEGFWSSVEHIWSGIKNTFSGIINFIKNVFTLNWKGAWQSVIDIFSGIFETLGGIATMPLNTIIGVVNTIIRAIASGLNAVIRMLNRIHFTIPSWVPGFGGNSFGFSISTITPPTIPYLASGAVIPPNKEFMAVLGDQKYGNNIEAPEGLIRRIVREETGGGNGNKYEVSAKVGRREIMRIIIDEAKTMQMQTGRNPFELA